MNLRHYIKKILREETNRDLSPIIQKLLNGFVNDHKDTICKVEVKNKRNKSPQHKYPYKNYSVTFYLIGGYGSSNWPTTQSVQRKYDELMNEAWDLVYNFIGQELEMFIKHVKSCNEMLSEDKKRDTIRNMIDKMSVADAIKMTGNYYMIEPYLKEIDKVNYIKEKVSQLSDDFGGNGFGLVEIDESPIFYSEDEDELRQIEYLGRKQLYVDVYSSDSNSNIGDFKVQYESLPGQILDELVEILINK